MNKNSGPRKGIRRARYAVFVMITDELPRGFETFLELIDTSACIDEFLFTREERMAFRTDFDAQIRFRGSCLHFFTASASDNDVFINGMDFFFHDGTSEKYITRILPCSVWFFEKRYNPLFR